MVGMTVADYEKRKNPYLDRFAKVGVNKPISKYDPSNMAKITALSTSTPTEGYTPYRSNQPWDANKGTGGITALGSVSNSAAPSPYLRQLDNPIFQPMYTGNTRQQSGMGILGAINQIGDIANAGMAQKIAQRNAQIRKFNSSVQSNASYNPFFQGGGGESGLDDEQMTNARIIADIGRSRGMDDNAIQIAIMTALTESSLRNVNYGDTAGPDSRGLFQQRPSQGWGTFAQVQDPRYAAGKFYDTLRGTNYSGLSPWQAAQAVQRSASSDGSNYQKNWALAQAAFRGLSSNTIQPMSVGGGNSAVANFITQNNNKYIDYDGAYGAQCVDLYNLYTARFVGGQNIMVGWAPELFNRYDTKAYTRIGANNKGMMGYVAIFNRGGQTPSGHVGIVVGDNGDGTLRLLHANATPAGSRGNTTISNISKASLMGYLVPNKLLGR
jgi:hypothetical protein